MEEKINFHNLTVAIEKGVISFSARHGVEAESVLTGTLGKKISPHSKIVHKVSEEELELDVADSCKLSITFHSNDSVPNSTRHDFKWTSSGLKELSDGFALGSSHWYGGCQVNTQLWPIEKWSMPLRAYVPHDSLNDRCSYGGVLERYFFSSAGVALFVDEKVPFFLSLNHEPGSLIFSSKYESPYYKPSGDPPEPLTLTYSLFLSPDGLKSVHQAASSTFIPRPQNIPDELTFRHPIWSTWATYKTAINQTVIMEFADKISSSGFKSCQLEIDDDWTPAYGDLQFDSKKFPNAKRMMEELKEKGFRVTLWVHPFASIRSNAAGLPYWLTSSFTRGYTRWWNGIAKCLDVTNPAALAWYKGCLQALQEDLGITSFKFDAGEINWLPYGYHSLNPMTSPCEYAKLYAEFCSCADTQPRAQEVRVGWRTQRLPVWVRMMDKQSAWGYDNGLKSLIPHALTFGLIGYPFVLPDMIGGNAYHGRPSKELYIRWMECNALLPCVQISVPPWEYDQEVLDITHKMLALHDKYTDLIISCAKESMTTGAPIVRPLWWIAPGDETAQTIDTEYLVGDDLLVAPILDEGATSRSVYLPGGSDWKCEVTGRVLEGGKWHENISGKLDELPYFTRVVKNFGDGNNE